MLRSGALVRADDSEERIASIFRVTRIGELGTLAVVLYYTILYYTIPSQHAPVAQVPPKRRFIQQPYGATSQKTAIFVDIAVKTSNLHSFTFVLQNKKKKNSSALSPRANYTD
jgi:hypothetical protein